WAILSSEPSFWTLLLAVAVLQVLTEAVIGFNYALGQIFVTPMALLMTNMAHHGEAAEMALSRIFDTTLGAAVGIVLALVLSSLDERVYLARHHGRAQ
ncbi:MAG: FUSC family protein, partial [Acidovorax sp.]|nr:FUSC family protein [Acidovorax sp.]